MLRRVRVSRSWVASQGASSRRTVRLSFWLPARTTVVVRVDQLAPECRYAGKFLVRGRRGRNVVRFRARLGRKTLAPGTYRLIAHPRGQPGRRLERATVVVFNRPPGSAAEARRARARNECPGGLSPSQIELGAVPPEPVGGNGKAGKGVAGAAAGTARGGLLDADGPIGRSVGKAVGTVEEVARTIPPALFGIAALAVLLLTVASMPQFGASSRAGAMLVHKRASFAVAGGAALLTAIVTYLVLVAL